MIVYPNAKINVGLHILRKREDGFHAIESVFLPVPMHDILETVEDGYSPSGCITFSSSGLHVPDDGKPNLCQRAYQMLHDRQPLPAVRMHLHKQIPIGAGLGGGSADGAFALKMLNDLFSLGHTTDHLEAMAAELGSDCPFFIDNRPKFVSGRGEVMTTTSIDLAGYHLLLVCPNIHISTAQAYASVRPHVSQPSLSTLVAQPLETWKVCLHNDFEKGLFLEYPLLQDIKEQLYAHGAIYASMTGSGSAIYGIFSSQAPMPQMQQLAYQWMKM